MRGSRSCVAKLSANRSAKSESTSYGVARSPYTNRLASRCAHWRTGWKATATTAVATTASRTLGSAPCEPTRVPTPTTTPKYTIVANAANTPTTTVFPITTSMSYSRYLRIAMPAATGMPVMAMISSAALIKSVVRFVPKNANANETGRNAAA